MEVADDFEDQLSEINFVPCVKFVKRGIASARNIADGIKLNANAQVFQELTGGGPSTSQEMAEDDDESGSESESLNENRAEKELPSANSPNDEFNFNDYDKELSESALKISDVVEVAEDQLSDDDNDSEAEDDIIKETDNLVLVGRVEADCSSLEVYIYNEEENSLYVHHDFLLPFHILCVEWFSFDAGSDKPGNLCAIGGMEPIIHIYDLDIHQPLEPVVTLGKKASKKKENTRRIGHKSAVLDLAWNSNYQHIMASASVDQTVILWDLENAIPSTILKDFAEKVQTIEFNAAEAEYLLTGCSDNTVKLFDCRQSSNEKAQYKQWIVEGEVEKVKWNPSEKYNFVVGTNGGKIMYFDSRTSDPLWIVEAHEKEVTDFIFNSKVPNVLTTSSVDNFLKMWKFDQASCQLAHKHHCKVGKVHSLHECPENNWIIGIGGDKRKKNFNVINLTDYETIKSVFINGEPIRNAPSMDQYEDDVDLDD